jgi:hypothetical protein
MKTATAMEAAALEYAERGVPVFPCWWIQAGQRCACGRPDCESPGKHPIGEVVPNGLKNATTDAALITVWWRRYPQAHIATPTSWCAVLDVDPRHGGDIALEALERQHEPLPETAEVLTGGGGRHIYFQPVDGLRCSSGHVGAGLDIRADGGYVLLPPSGHVSGGTYVDELCHPLFDTPLAPLPAWVLARAPAKASQNGDGPPGPHDWAALLAGAPAGARHSIACQIAGHYLRALGADAAGEVEQILIGFCVRCAPPFPEVEARGIVRDLALKERQARAAKVAPRPLRMVGAGDFLAEPDMEAVALVDGVLSDDGGGWLGGEEKLGKSWWAIEEAVCLAFSLPVCGRFAVPERRRVVLLEEEDSPRRVRRRLRALLRGKGLDPDAATVRAELNAWLRVSVWSGFSLDNAEMVAQLRTVITEFQPTVIYVDCVRKVTVRNLNHADEASALLAILDELRREFGCIFRLIHHYRKQQGFRTGRGSQEIGGSYVLGAWGENSLFFEPIGRKTGAVRVEVQSKDGAPVPAFRLRLESEGWAHAPILVRLFAEDDASESGVDDVVADAVATLPTTPAVTGKPGVTVKALANGIKKSDKTVREALKRLQIAGQCLEVGMASRGLKLYGVET